MAKLYVDTIEPEGATTNLAIGESGQDVIVTGNDIRANVLQDVGGNALFTSDGSGSLTGVNTGFGDALKLISSQTASTSASISFTSGITSTYKEYIFKYYNINPVTDAARFTFQCSTDGGSNYNLTLTSTYFRASHAENDSGTTFPGSSDQSQAQGTAYQELTRAVGNESDECACGELHLFNPASTTYVKNFIGEDQRYSGTWTGNGFQGGYFNTTSAINAISFKMDSGNINAGTIKMYGVL